MITFRPLALYYQYIEQDKDYICSRPDDNGMHKCDNLPHYREGDMICNDSAVPNSINRPTDTSCVNWNQYYTECMSQGSNPFQGTISFDNIGLAWVAIFLVSAWVRSREYRRRPLLLSVSVQTIPDLVFFTPFPSETTLRYTTPFK